ncbi:dimethylsulfonioproprionate lyase family protein [Lichenihabitans psoromatis]|uniref:dimethylsulfonioproprionate lyase family protein n=1 Tax=Lichenihabitans psoromatis TaxID=2528642 RepID=UPI00103855A7|nr:dimethylsulfonioproprionate lyase family protein [Lichenihabitans psoromatis]
MTTVTDPSAAAEVLTIVALAYGLLDTMPTAQPFLAAWPDQSDSRPFAPQGCPVLTWLDEIAANTTPATAPVVAALSSAAAALAWRQSYMAADFGAAFLDRYGWTELIGTKGPVPSATIACGFLMLGPWTQYPAHAHAAEELYVPLSGTALWTRGDEAPVRHRPGAPIHHPAWISHAMSTEAEPLLALYLWRGGDLAAKPQITGRSSPLSHPPKASGMPIALGRDRLTVADVRQVARDGVVATLDPDAARTMLASQAVLQDWLQADRPVYGLTRGLGNQATIAIPSEDRRLFSEAMLKARASGAGGSFAPDIVRAALFVRAATLARGGAGARPLIVETQLAMLNQNVTPRVPRIGSIGTSDLMLCANMGLPLIGLGEATFEGKLLPGAEAMRRAGIDTVQLTEKEGLALCSSNAVSIGYGALVIADLLDLLDLADAVLAMTYEAFMGNPSPFDARVAAHHPAPGQVEAAEQLRRMLAGSALFEPGVPRRVQDPISLRCATHVHGAARTALRWAQDAVDAELNAAADNPLILIDDAEILSTGNFHTAAMAVAFDALRLALAQLGTIASQRTARLLDPEVSGLGGLLTRIGVTKSGVGLLGLVSHTLDRESRACSAPVSNDGATPFGVEDQAPMTLSAVRRTADQIGFLQQILACEMMVAAQALDIRPLRPSAPVVAALYGFVRRHVTVLDEDRSTTADLENLHHAMRDGGALAIVRTSLDMA